jgi:hypothetical protein
MQIKQVQEEFETYGRFYAEGGGRTFPPALYRRAAEHYNVVQRWFVKRSQSKRQIMATCLKHACAEAGLAPTGCELAEHMQLRHKGIARGDNFVRSLVADGRMDVDVHADPTAAEVAGLFVRLFGEASRGEDAQPGVRRAPDRYAPLRAAAADIVATAVREHVAVSSVLRSKVAGAVFLALARCRDPALVPRPPDLGEFCRNSIRKNTLTRVLHEIGSHHSLFVPCYLRAGLDASPPGERVPSFA